MPTVKLYEVPSDTRVRVIDEEYKKENGKYLEVTFHHLDGMYSFCKDDNDNVVHLAVWTKVQIVK
jgi:hypothetical protein